MPLDPGIRALKGKPRPDGSRPYQVIVYAGKDRTGKQRQRGRSFYAKGDRDANRKADDVRSSLRAELLDTGGAMPTMAAFVAQWLATKETLRSPTTVDGYRAICRRITGDLGRLPVNKVTPDVVQNWYTKLLRAGMTPTTLDHHHAVLRGVMRSAKRRRLVADDPTFGSERPSVIAKPITLPKDADMLRLIRSAKGDMAIAVRLAAACGLRRGELAGLRWCDVIGRDLHVRRANIETSDRGILTKETKGKRERAVSLDGATMRDLARHRRHQAVRAAELGAVLAPAAEWAILADLAADPTGRTAYTPTWLSRSWEAVRGPVKVRLHDLRHWYATKVLESGEATVAELSRWLGHAQVSTTMNIYVHASPERRKVSGQIMGRALALGQGRATNARTKENTT